MKKFLSSPSVRSALLGFGFLSLATVARLLPHPANFAPIGAIALFGGIYLPKRWSLLIPLGALFISDIVIGFYNPVVMTSVYLSFVAMWAIGLASRNKKTFSRTIGGAIAGSVIFFMVTNAAVWMFGAMYPTDISGLFASYTAGLPFFKNTLLGNLFYVSLLSGTAELFLSRSKTFRLTDLVQRKNHPAGPLRSGRPLGIRPQED